MHSGTTLVSDMLKRHPKMYGGRGETKFFALFPMLVDKFPDLTRDEDLGAFAMTVRRIIVEKGYTLMRFARGERRAESGASDEARAFVESYDAPRSHIGVIRRVYEDLVTAGEHSHWIENSPNHVFHIDHIAREIPDALFIEVVRDGRDIVASKKLRTASVGPVRYPKNEVAKRREKAYDPLWDALAWRSAIRGGISAAQDYGPRVKTIRYEDLVAEPQKVIVEVCRFLGLDFVPSLLEVERVNPADAELAGTPGIADDTVGRWSRGLSGPELAIVQRAARKELAHHRYTPADLPTSARLKAPLLLVASVGRLTGRLANRWRMGGRRFFSTTVRGYWRRLGRPKRR
jgi:hypothetical protein